MRLPFLSFLFVTLALTAGGCGTFRVEAGFVQPAALTPTAEAGSIHPTATPAPISKTTNAPAPGTARPSTPTSPFVQNVQSGSTSQPASAEDDTDAAVQTILDYFDALNEGDYRRAYRYWSGEGASSLRSYDEFARGYANTVHADVQIGTVSEEGSGPDTFQSSDRIGAGIARSRTVSVTLAAIVNEPDHTQRVQRFQGTYTLQPGAGTASKGAAWQIASANIAEVSSDVETPADVADPLSLVRSYFEAIDRREFARAYTYWGGLGKASKQTFAEFHQGFANTDHVTVDVGNPKEDGAAGSAYADVRVIIVATQGDQKTQTFCGTYTLRSTIVPPFDQLGWRIEGAKTTVTSNVQPGSAEAQSLLNSCTK